MQRLPDSADGLGHPRRHLAHLVSRTDKGDEHWQDYKLQSISIARPEQGHASVTLQCQVCSEPVEILIHSSDQTRSMRARQHATGIAVMATGCIATIAFFVLSLSSSTGVFAILFALFLPLPLLMIAAGISDIKSWSDEDGVRLVAGGLHHSLREPGSIAGSYRDSSD